MESNDIQSVIGLTVQCAGIILITGLSLFMTRSIRRACLNYWTAGWVCLSVSLLALSIAFRVSASRHIAYPIYFLGEYAFGFLFLSGCRNYASGSILSKRHWYVLVPGSALAVGISLLTSDFNEAFIPHAAIVAVLFGAAFSALLPAHATHSSPGLRVMSTALVLLTLDFLHYVPVMTYVRLSQATLPPAYLKYTSIYDLILEILLGFGTLMLVMDEARREVEVSNRELIAARDKLEVLARIDPLTEALNRHAFYSLLDGDEEAGELGASGCVVVLDIDNLKPINDSLGHPAGDAAIRDVARAIRSVIRADDLLFRWGGDEFLILCFNISEAAARKRIEEMDASLAFTSLPGAAEPLRLIVSYGVAGFSGARGIEPAIDAADEAMYASKQARKRSGKLAG
jgi:diguanylate cyclase (GGDEF)-like protein